MRLFISLGVNINARDCDNNTPLMYAVFSKHHSMVEKLLYCGAVMPSNKQGNDQTVNRWIINIIVDLGLTLLHHYAMNSAVICETTLQAILNCTKGDINAKAKSGYTAFHFYVSSVDDDDVDDDSVHLLLKYGAVINVQNNVGDSPLHIACVAGKNKLLITLLELCDGLELEEVFRYTDICGQNLLHLAILNNNISDETIRLIVDYGGVTNGRNRRGQTPLDLLEESSRHMPHLSRRRSESSNRSRKDLHLIDQYKHSCYLRNVIIIKNDSMTKSDYPKLPNPFDLLSGVLPLNITINK